MSLITPQVIRALFVAVNALERVNKIESRKGDLPSNAGQAWTTEQDNQLISLFEEGKTISELAKMHERTNGAISARLMKLGKITK